ncbi:MAG: hypothetical protein IJC69_03515 [Clostridia bacterium]|nr:hypothetical protein [Clostridia bacterium]
MSKKVYATIGMLISLALVIIGIVSMCGGLGGNTSYPGSAPYTYDSGYAMFNADYYTYSVNNSAEAASAAHTAAANLDDIGEFLSLACGLFMVCLGLISFCGFGIVLSTCPKRVVTLPEAETFSPDFFEAAQPAFEKAAEPCEAAAEGNFAEAPVSEE